MTYGDVYLQAEQEFSAYNFEHADTELLFQHFADAESGMRGCWLDGRAKRAAAAGL